MCVDMWFCCGCSTFLSRETLRLLFDCLFGSNDSLDISVVVEAQTFNGLLLPEVLKAGCLFNERFDASVGRCPYDEVGRLLVDVGIPVEIAPVCG